MSKEPSVVDFSNGHYKFAIPGATLRQSIVEKIRVTEMAYTDLLNMISREIGDNSKSIAGLMVGMYAPDCNERTRYIIALCQRAADLEKNIMSLKRIYRTSNDAIVYVLGVNELELFGV